MQKMNKKLSSFYILHCAVRSPGTTSTLTLQGNNGFRRHRKGDKTEC